MSEAGPRNLLDLTSQGQTKKTEFLVGDPQISRLVLGDGLDRPAGNAAHWNKSVVLHVAELAKGGGPDSPSTILKKRIRVKPIEFPVSFYAAGTGNRNLPVIPSVQATKSGEPDASLFVR